MDEIRFLTDSSIVIRILFSLVIGGILGLERGSRIGLQGSGHTFLYAWGPASS